MKSYTFFSWNVNGIRAAEKKGFLDWLGKCNGDIVAVQETKADSSQISWELQQPAGYQSYWSSGQKKGYSGVATFTKEKPLQTRTGFNESQFDTEGRILISEFKDFVFFNIYFPNGGQGPHRIDFKLRFYKKFLDIVDSYRKKKIPVIITGDVNTAFAEIDLARPKENTKHSGFLPEERKALAEFYERGLIDTYRLLHPQTVAYTWWDQKSRARDRNIGWRIDYFFVTSDLKNKIISADIHSSIMGSDHCPISLTLAI